MSWWKAKYKNDHGEYEITFGSKDYDKAKAVEKVCKAVIDKEVKTPEDVSVVVRCRECKKKNKKKCPMVIVNFGRNGKEILVQNHVPDDFYCAAGERKEGANHE